MIDFISMFFSVLLAFIVKDFYDIFIRNHIKSLMEKYKVIVVNTTIKDNK